jgi:hypothetical protein
VGNHHHTCGCFLLLLPLHRVADNLVHPIWTIILEWTVRWFLISGEHFRDKSKTPKFDIIKEYFNNLSSFSPRLAATFAGT